MKRLIIILGTAMGIALSMSVTPAVNAQERENRDEYGKIVRGPYLTNRFCDNWFMAVGGGINFFWTDGAKVAVGPSLDANFGKWFTPAIGMRVGYQGLSSRFWTDIPSVLGNVLDTHENMYLQKLGYLYIHGDFLWNISDAIGGHKERRFWNFVPYVHAGYFRSYGLKDVDFHRDEIAAGIGLLHNLRLCKYMDLAIDMRAMAVNGRASGAAGGVAVLPSVTMGLSVNLGCPSFTRYSRIRERDRQEDANTIGYLESVAISYDKENNALKDENNHLKKENKKLKNQLFSHKPASANNESVINIEDMEPMAIYFEIGKTDLSAKEMKHLEYVAENILENVDACRPVCLTVVGTADGNTGSHRRNEALSEARAKLVFDILTQKYGIAPERLIIKSEITGKVAQPEFSRAVFISF